MKRPSRDQAVSLALAAGAFVLALVQRPGVAVADTKIDLHVSPAAFLGDVASVWSDSGGLGQVQAGQYSGYLWPMAPFFAAARALGVAPWLAHRLWLGLLLALAAWGTVRLLDALAGRPRGTAHVVAGVLVLLNPYVLLFASRTSVTLLGYAALPWLLLAVHRGAREPGGWRWPAAFALLVACTGGGVNAAVTAWLMLGPALLLGYEVLLGTLGRRQAAGFAARAALLAVGASLWWIAPVALHARYGLNFLPLTESAGSIWATTSMSESVRLMGYWISYLGAGFGDRLVPSFETIGTLLFDPLPIVASFAVPGAALAGYAWTRRLTYGPFLLGLLLLGLLVMVVGFPEGVPLRRGATFAYNRLEPVQFLRTTYKAAPLAALALACLGGMAAAELRRRTARRPALLAAAALAGALAVTATAWPLLTGRGVDPPIAYGDVPPAWVQAADELDRELAPGTRALVLPGQLFPFYEWGATQDPILPALSERPVTARSIVGYSDLRAADLLYVTDGLLAQRRLIPGQLGPLLALMGVGAVVTGSDDERRRSGSPEQAGVEADFRREPALGEPEREYGPVEAFAPPAGELAGGARLAQVRRYDLPPAPGLVRVEAEGPQTVVDGSAEALAGLAAFEALPAGLPLFYAADLSGDELRRAAAEGGEVVVSDTNRRRVFTSSRPRQSAGPTLAADEEASRDAAVLNPFPERGADGQTVAVLEGARAIRAPSSPAFSQFPEHRPYAALDGSPNTYWVADRSLAEGRRWLEIELDRPTEVGEIELLPQRESATDVAEVEIAGRRHAIRVGWNRLRVDAGRVTRLRILITAVSARTPREAGPGAIAEARVPGVRVTERVRPPQLVESGLAGADLRRATLTYLLARSTGDDPFRRSERPDPDRGSVATGRSVDHALISEAGDAEREIERVLRPPAARRFGLDAWVSPAADAPDDELDRLAGVRSDATFTSSSRWLGRPAHRASSAFDGLRETGWVAPLRSPAAWIAWRTPRPVSVSSLVLEEGPGGVAAPRRVRVRWAGRSTPVLAVGEGGRVQLPEPARARAFRLEVLEAGPAPPGRRGKAVGIGELRVPGVERVRVPRAGPLPARCGAVRVIAGGATARLRVRGSIAALDAGRPLRARLCGAALALPAAEVNLATESRLFATHLLRVRSPAPDRVAAPAGGGVVTDVGEGGRGRRDGVRVDLEGPSWLVLGESYNAGWRAWCGERSLGEPRPIDGYANGWKAPADCTNVRFAFAPNRIAHVSYAFSALVVVFLLALLLVGRRRRVRAGSGDPLRAGPRERGTPAGAGERREPEPCERVPAAPDSPRRWPLRRAALLGLVLVPVASFMFSIRAGVVIGPVVGFLLWRGVGPAALATVAGLLVALFLPVVYVVATPEDLGGYNSDYAADLLGAHWIALAAFVALALALSRAPALSGLSRASRASGARAAARPAGAAGPGPP